MKRGEGVGGGIEEAWLRNHSNGSPLARMAPHRSRARRGTTVYHRKRGNVRGEVHGSAIEGHRHP